MNDTNKIKLSTLTANASFWIAIIITFFKTKGFQLNETYLLITFFSTAIVILEYPTGVIGDFFSHKLSVQLGYFITSLAILLGTLSLPKSLYFLILLIWALGSTLKSGSDMALLHYHSNNFKKDVSDLKYISLIVLGIATALGNWMAKYNINYPLYATALTQFVAGLILIGIPDTKKNIGEKGNVYLKARKGIVLILGNKKLLSLITIGATFTTLMLGMKWFYNSLFEALTIPTKYWGILVTISLGLIALGSFLARKSKKTNLKTALIIALITFSLIGITDIPRVVLSGLFLYSFAHGFYDVVYEDLINKKIEDNFRASILSAKSLVTRILYAFYTFMAGVALNYINVFTFFIFTSAVVVGIILINYKTAKLS